MERTLVVLKPDAVTRGLAGEIIARFEKVGLKIVGARLFVPDKKMLDAHYPAHREEFVIGLGQRTLDSYREMGLQPKEQFGHADPKKIGHTVRDWLVESMQVSPVLAMVLEGPHAIEIVRKLVGATLPQKSEPGTIRGDYSFDSSYLANTNQRPIRNLIHASGNQEEADFEIKLWFKPSELFAYDTIHQKHMKG